MALRKSENVKQSQKSKAEAWMAGRIQETGIRWTRQAQWGHRLFDFWSAALGIAVEVDGPEHDAAYDLYRDEYNFRRSAIVVVRVPNFSDEDASKAVGFIRNERTWNERKTYLKVGDMDVRLWIASLPYPPSFLKRYLAGEFPFPKK